MAEFHITPEMQASKGMRFAHTIIDTLAMYAILIVVLFIFGFVGMLLGNGDALYFRSNNSALNILLWSVFYFAYFFLWEAFTGRTLAKFITGTIVVHDSGDKATMRTIAKRTLCRMIPFDALSFFGDGGWHDSLSATCVVKKHIYLLRKNEAIEFDEIGKDSQIL